jgi:hypothetical protein
MTMPYLATLVIVLFIVLVIFLIIVLIINLLNPLLVSVIVLCIIVTVAILSLSPSPPPTPSPFPPHPPCPYHCCHGHCLHCCWLWQRQRQRQQRRWQRRRRRRKERKNAPCRSSRSSPPSVRAMAQPVSHCPKYSHHYHPSRSCCLHLPLLLVGVVHLFLLGHLFAFWRGERSWSQITIHEGRTTPRPWQGNQ